jgi:nicotinamide-nucleotide amidase
VDDIVADELRSRGLTLAAAESCTGGLLGSRITARPGSSDYFLGGVISYSNQAKMDLLQVPPGMLAQYGAVSEEVAGAMAEGARETLRADFALSITGVAGPDGGTPDKPVGLVYLGCAGPDGRQVRRGWFPGDRDSVRTFSATSALHLLRRALLA